MLYKVVVTFKSFEETPVCDHSDESYRVVLSCDTAVVCYVEQVGSIFKSVDKTLVCDHSNESYRAVLPFGTAYYAIQGGVKF